MTVGELIKKLQEFPETDQVELFIGDLENKRMSTMTMATQVMRCPVRFGMIRNLDWGTTVWIVG
jgi:hypothetical protein